ncbi:MAG: hypothetical protein IKX23_08400 [Treponema sp.]|nr:hypothetical protein [Treponema sp.]
MKKQFFICMYLSVIMLFFVSCPLLEWTDPDDYKSLDDLSYITEKTAIKKFSHLTEPIVITMPVWETRYYKGKRKGKTQKFKIGDIFVVIDIEKNEVFDWVYFGGKTGLTLYRPLELGNPVKYYVTSDFSNEVICLDPGKTQLSTIETTIYDCHFLNLNTSTKTSYGLRAHRHIGYKEEDFYYEYEILDSSTDTVLAYKPQIPSDTEHHVFDAIVGSDGNFYFGNHFPKEKETDPVKAEIIKLDIINSSWKRYDLNLINYIGKECFGYSIKYVNFNRMFITRIGDNSDDLLIFKKTADGYELEKEIFTDFDSIKEIIKKIVEIDGTIYIIASNCFNDYSYVDIYRLTDDLEMEKINPDWATTNIKEDEKFKITFTENVWVRGTKIYFMNSWNTSKVAYRYYNVESGEYSTQPVWIDFKDVVR